MTTIWERILGTAPQSQPQPQTQLVEGSSEKNPYERSGWDNAPNRRETIKRCKQVYARGGPISDALDAYPLFALTNGWGLVCEDGAENLKDMVQDWLDQPQVDLDMIMWQGILDAIICGTAFQEIVPDRGGSIWGIVPRDASSFEIVYDQYGRVTGYNQVLADSVPGLERRIGIEKDRVLTVTLFPVPGEMYGVSLVARAWDDILRDTDTIESIAKAIHRHGTGKHSVSIGEPGEVVSKEQLDTVKREFKKMSTNDFFIHGPSVKIEDIGGTLVGLNEYSNIMLQRLACALGVPEEILGLGRGSTEATATVRLKTFYDKISTIQEIVARTYTRNLIDRITGQPGMVWLEFNDVSPQDEKQKAEWIAMLRQGMDPDAIVPADWAREQFGIPPDEDLYGPEGGIPTGSDSEPPQNAYNGDEEKIGA